MRDAFGGVFTMNFLLVFIFIYVAFTAVSLNYAKAFRVKNAVIDFVEQSEIQDLDEYFSNGLSSKDFLSNLFYQGATQIVDLPGVNKATKSTTQLDDILTKMNYHKTCDSLGYTEGEVISNTNGGITTKKDQYGYCYKGVVIMKNKEQPIEGTNSKIVYYQVITYADWELGALNKLLALAGRDENSESVLSGTWKVKGEAKVVVKG